MPKNSIRIKGKKTTIMIDPQDNKSMYSAAIVLSGDTNSLNISSDAVIIKGPGEYEIGGVKINGVRSSGMIAYVLLVDGVEIMVGSLSALDKLQHKLNEQNIVVVNVDTAEVNTSFVTSLASNVILYYGEKVDLISSKLGDGSANEIQKYSANADKLPQEVETSILK